MRKISRNRLRSLLGEFNLSRTVELYEQIGLGERLGPLIAQALVQSPSIGPGVSAKPSVITIAGTEGMVVSYARCCHPIPGDDIMGYMSSGRGVIIHRDVCGNLVEFRKQPNKWISVEWQPDIKNDFSAEIRVEVSHRPGMLAEVATRIADAGSNIKQVSVDEGDEKDGGDAVELPFTILVPDRIALAKVIRQIRTLPGVKRVIRPCA